MPQKCPPELKDADWMKNAYITMGLTTHEIAHRLNCSQGGVWKWLKYHGIQSRPSGRDRASEKLHDKMWLEKAYSQYSTHEIAKLLNCGQITVWKAMKNLDIPLKLGRRLKISRCKRELGPDGNYHLQHRLIMEKILGRRLLPTEDVHHIDKNPRNNDPSNLIVLPEREHHLLHLEERKTMYNRKCVHCDRYFIGGFRTKYCPVCKEQIDIIQSSLRQNNKQQSEQV